VERSLELRRRQTQGALLAIIEPGDLNAQLRQLNQGRARVLNGIIRLKRELDVNDAYVQAIIERMNAEGRLGTSDIDDLGAEELRKVIVALREHKRRGVEVLLATQLILKLAQMTGLVLSIFPRRKDEPDITYVAQPELMEMPF
jgi:hypothetical protein